MIELFEQDWFFILLFCLAFIASASLAMIVAKWPPTVKPVNPMFIQDDEIK